MTLSLLLSGSQKMQFGRSLAVTGSVGCSRRSASRCATDGKLSRDRPMLKVSFAQCLGTIY